MEKWFPQHGFEKSHYRCWLQIDDRKHRVFGCERQFLEADIVLHTSTKRNKRKVVFGAVPKYNIRGDKENDQWLEATPKSQPYRSIDRHADGNRLPKVLETSTCLKFLDRWAPLTLLHFVYPSVMLHFVVVSAFVFFDKKKQTTFSENFQKNKPISILDNEARYRNSWVQGPGWDRGGLHKWCKKYSTRNKILLLFYIHLKHLMLKL